jgi:hypothetical protein
MWNLIRVNNIEGHVKRHHVENVKWKSVFQPFTWESRDKNSKEFW